MSALHIEFGFIAQKTSGYLFLQLLGIGLIVIKGKPAALLWPMKEDEEKSWIVFRESTGLQYGSLRS